MINTIRMDDILSISNLHKHYVRNGFFGKKLPPVKAVDGISFSIKPGNVLVLAGESGSGKSTIARLILGAEEADSGTIRFGGNKVDYATGSLEYHGCLGSSRKRAQDLTLLCDPCTLQRYCLQNILPWLNHV